MRDRVGRVRRRLIGRDRPGLDLFRKLELEARLTRLAGELKALEDESGSCFALRHHAVAATRAYEQTLDEACELQHLPVSLGGGPSDRLLAEASLLQAGWSW